MWYTMLTLEDYMILRNFKPCGLPLLALMFLTMSFAQAQPRLGRAALVTFNSDEQMRSPSVWVAGGLLCDGSTGVMIKKSKEEPQINVPFSLVKRMDFVPDATAVETYQASNKVSVTLSLKTGKSEQGTPYGFNTVCMVVPSSEAAKFASDYAPDFKHEPQCIFSLYASSFSSLKRMVPRVSEGWCSKIRKDDTGQFWLDVKPLNLKSVEFLEQATPAKR